MRMSINQAYSGQLVQRDILLLGFDFGIDVSYIILFSLYHILGITHPVGRALKLVNALSTISAMAIMPSSSCVRPTN